MVFDEIRAEFESIANESILYDEVEFDRRIRAIDHIEFRIIGRIDALLQAGEQPELASLREYAEGTRRQLERINLELFRRLRADIRMGVCTGPVLRSRIERYVGRALQDDGRENDIGYDSLDAFIAGLLLFHPFPAETRKREPEMVYHQPTPGRIILELIEKANLTKDDVFYDLGSGLGQVPILVNLLSGARAKGVEFEPAYCDYARRCTAELELSQIQFINEDARQADYSDGTAFFMYTPFQGKLLLQVLEKLRQESRTRTIRLFTYGPCTAQVSREKWLQRRDENGNRTLRLGIFSSR